MKKLSESQKSKFISNLKKFTFPVLAVFFAQLALKVPAREASLVALYALYAVARDFFKKAK